MELKIFAKGTFEKVTRTGGWCAVATDGERIEQLSGTLRNTTPNSPAFVAVARSLEMSLLSEKPRRIVILTDQQLVPTTLARWFPFGGERCANAKRQSVPYGVDIRLICVGLQDHIGSEISVEWRAAEERPSYFAQAGQIAYAQAHRKRVPWILGRLQELQLNPSAFNFRPPTESTKPPVIWRPQATHSNRP